LINVIPVILFPELVKRKTLVLDLDETLKNVLLGPAQAGLGWPYLALP